MSKKKQIISEKQIKKSASSRVGKLTQVKKALLAQLANEVYFPLVGIGASAGGYEALRQFFQTLPVKPGLSLVIIMHLDPSHKSGLKDMVARMTEMPVEVIKDGVKPQIDHVYVTPANALVEFAEGQFRLKPRLKRSITPNTIDHFFCSLAGHQKQTAIGMLLSGAGSDGVAGLKEIKARGGIAFVQSLSSAQVTSMPESAISAGVADYVLSPEQMAEEVVAVGRCVISDVPQNLDGDFLSPDSVKDLDKIFHLLRVTVGADFSNYKSATIKRRILRRMMILKMDHLKDYVAHLEKTPSEVESLYHDLLIQVTSFFRDPQLFKLLTKKIFPQWISKKSEDTIRIWVPGCATGEEPYSIAMCLHDFLQKNKVRKQIQIFATDISETAINIARSAIYAESQTKTLPAELKKAYLEPGVCGYKVKKEIRDLCIFATHDVTRDPPFSRLDLVSFRNVLIYLGAQLKKKILPMFHYALKPSGYLILGTSESTGEFGNLFTALDTKLSVYTKKNVNDRMPVPFDHHMTVRGYPDIRLLRNEWQGFDLEKEADRIVLFDYAPAGVVINEDLTIIQIRGQTGKFLEPTPGEASLNLLKMAREGLVLDLRTAIHEAKKRKTRVRKPSVKYKLDDKICEVQIEVVPLQSSFGSKEQYYLVLFHDSTPALDANSAVKKTRSGSKLQKQKEDTLAERLKYELQRTKEYLLTVTEEQEASNEELRSANEEILSSNEELQSTNEELETAKEELQATNEELTTLNEELQNRNSELNRINSDLNNLFTSVNIPLVMLNKDLVIRNFTPMAERFLRLNSSDVGRSILEHEDEIPLPNLPQLIKQVISTGKIFEKEVQDKKGHWHQLRILPYMTLTHQVDGAVLAFLDVDALKRSLEQLQQSRDYAEAIIDTVADALLVLDAELKVKTANNAYYSIFKKEPSDTLNHRLEDLAGGQWDVPELRKLLKETVLMGTEFQNFEVEFENPQMGRKTWFLNAKRIESRNSLSPLVLLAMHDVTLHKNNERLQQTQLAVTRILAYTTSLEEAIPKLLQVICERVGWELGEMWFLDKQNQNLTLQENWSNTATFHKFMDETRKTPVKLGTSFVGQVGESCQPLWIEDISKSSQFKRQDLALREGVRGACAFPVRTDTEVIGVMAFYSHHSRVADEHIMKMLTDKGMQIGLYIKRKRAEAALKVTYDELEDRVRERTAELSEINYKLQASESYFRMLAEAIPQMVWTSSPDGTRDFMNQRWGDFVGKTQEEILKFGPDDAMHPDDIVHVREAWQMALRQGHEYEVEFRLKSAKDGQYHWFLARALPLRNAEGKITKWFGTCTDIDDKKRVQEKVEEANTELNRVNKIKTEFTSMVSHELRTPLAAIKQGLELVLDGVDGPVTLAQRETLGITQSSVDRLARLIQNVLNFSKLESGQFELFLEPVHLNNLIAEVYQLMAMAAKKKNILLSNVASDCDIEVVCDPDKIMQVLINLLDNAIKYTESDGQITIRCFENGDNVSVEVEDSGSGILPEDQEKIFEMFGQSSRKGIWKTGGVGVGLAICKKLVEQHHGTISVKSAPGKGATFKVVLPKDPRKEETKKARKKSA